MGRRPVEHFTSAHDPALRGPLQQLQQRLHAVKKSRRLRCLDDDALRRHLQAIAFLAQRAIRLNSREHYCPVIAGACLLERQRKSHPGAEDFRKILAPSPHFSGLPEIIGRRLGEKNYFARPVTSANLISSQICCAE